MAARWLNEGILYGLALTLGKFTGIFLAPIYTRFLTQSEYGLLDLATTFGVLLFLVSETQMVSAFQRNYYDVRKKGQLHLLAGSISFYYVLGCGVWVLAIWFGRSLLLPRMPGFEAAILIPLLVDLLPAQIVQLAQQALRLEHRTKGFVWFSMGKVLLSAIFGIVSVVVFEKGVLGILWGLAIADLLLTPAALLVLLRITGLRLSTRFMRESLCYGAPMVPGILGNWMLPNASRFFIATALSLSLLGSYSIATKLASVMMLAAVSFRQAWEPYAFQKFEAPDSERFFARSVNFFLGGMFIVLVALGCGAPLLVRLLAAREYWGAEPFVVAVATGVMWNGANEIFNAGNIWERKTYHNALGNLLGGAVNVLILWLGTAALGLPLVAGAFIVSAFVKGLVVLAWAQRTHYVPYSHRMIVLTVLSSVAYAVFCFFTGQWGMVPWVAVMGINLAGGAAAATLLWSVGLPPEDRRVLLAREGGTAATGSEHRLHDGRAGVARDT